MIYLKHIGFRFVAQYFFVIAMVSLCLFASDAYAGGATLAQCAASGGFPPTALTGPIVYCIQTTIQNAVVGALQNLSDYFKSTTIVVMTLAVTMHGARMISGERGINAKSMVTMMKIVFVSYFSYNLGGFANNVFGIMNEVLFDAVGAFSPWTVIDNILGTLFGFAPGVLLFQGLAWLADGLTSGTPDAGMSMSVLVAFIELILFVIEIVYTFLSAYIVVAFMLIMSPMFVPLIIFQTSEQYFRRWLEVIIGAMLIPVMIFAALAFSLALYTTLICNIIAIILPTYSCQVPFDPNNPPDFSPFWRMNQPVLSMTLGVDPNMTNDIDTTLHRGPGDSRNVPSAHTTVNPFQRGGFDMAGWMHPPGINFGRHNNTIDSQLIFALISLWIYTMILKKLIEKMPGVAQDIAGISIGISLKGPKLQEKLTEIRDHAVSAVTTSTGALAGGQLGGVAGNAVIAEAGAIGGGILGNVLGRRLVR